LRVVVSNRGLTHIVLLLPVLLLMKHEMEQLITVNCLTGWLVSLTPATNEPLERHVVSKAIPPTVRTGWDLAAFLLQQRILYKVKQLHVTISCVVPILTVLPMNHFLRSRHWIASSRFACLFHSLWTYPASEMTCIVSSGALNSTHSLTCGRISRTGGSRSNNGPLQVICIPHGNCYGSLLCISLVTGFASL